MQEWRLCSIPNMMFEGQIDPNKLYIIEKGIHRRVQFILDIDKNFRFCYFMSNFCEIVKFRPFLKLEKFKLFEAVHLENQNI